MPTRYDQEFRSAASRARRSGTEAEEDYLERIRGFDARRSAREAAGATFEDFSERLGRTLESFRGSQVGRGRLRTGFGFEDEDRLVETLGRGLTRDLAQQSLSAESLNLRALEGLGGYGERTTGRYLDILTGERDVDLLEQERKRREAAAKRSAIFGLAGTVGGALLGPAGAAIGNRLGTAVGGLMD